MVKVGVVKSLANVMVCPDMVLVSTTSVPTRTAPLKVAPLLWVTVSVLSVAVLPTKPDTSTCPFVPEFSVTAWALFARPFKDFAKVMLAPDARPPLLVVSNMVVDAVTTASSAIKIELGLLVRTKPPMNLLLPCVSVSKWTGAVTEPMAPV